MSTENTTQEQDKSKRPLTELYNFRQLVNVATQLGITKINVTYNGGGDEGIVDQIEVSPECAQDLRSISLSQSKLVYSPNEPNPSVNMIACTMHEAITNLFNQSLIDYGIELDQDCTGVFTLDVKEEEIEIEKTLLVNDYSQSYRSKFK